ncbi:MAG: nitrous oxide reductase accessory protein NosL [Gammaproteobacteria bacterium]|nr:nitrous oxide reductase accessory protein NosL [Gammaproteobacteria bacterium]
MRLLPSLFMFMLLSACSQEDATGPGKVRWDQESCARCAMAVSDRNYAAQVRGADAGSITKLYKFDDIGCAVIWLKKQQWKDDPRTEIWVTDHQNGQWIDARKASYVTGKITPMGYGLGAQPEATEGSLDFAGARKHIMIVESTEHIHRGRHAHQ